MTDKQRLIAQQYCAKSMLYIHDQEKFDAVIKEFEEWKKSEGLS